ncbi:MAG: hypothetical protein ACOVOV_15955, partial [Dolichospermum sp.]
MSVLIDQANPFRSSLLVEKMNYPHCNKLYFQDGRFVPSGEISYWCDGILVKDIGAASLCRRDFNTGKKLYVFPRTISYQKIIELVSAWQWEDSEDERNYLKEQEERE